MIGFGEMVTGLSPWIGSNSIHFFDLSVWWPVAISRAGPQIGASSFFEFLILLKFLAVDGAIP